jgi:tetratricopeptide (TPR) repeat protein
MSDVVPLLKFTPSAQSAGVLESITVQREPLIAALVEGALDDEGDARHQLLVGPRGIGKTHILSLVASRIGVADNESIVVAWLDEDPWAIRSYGKLVAAIVTRVAIELDDAELAEAASALRSRGDEGPAAEELLRRAVGDRRMVLLAENLDEVFRRIGPDGQARFRAFAEDWRRLLIIATTPQLFTGVRRHESPFYGFFAVTHLEELSLENAVELLKRIARLRDDDELLEFLSTDKAMSRLVAVQALAGGHPRIWLLLAGCISVAAIDELVPLFLEAIDDLTPYYQDRLRMLGDQQQELVILLSEAGGALSNRELAERSGIAQNQVATILGQLADRGYLRRAELPDGLASGDRRMSFWELREPLMRLCLDVKQARGGPLRIVVEFLREWYGPRLLDELVRLPASARLAVTYASEAVRTLGAALASDILLEGSPGDVIARAERGLTLLPENAALLAAKATGLARDERYAEALELLSELRPMVPPGAAMVAIQVQMALCQKGLGEDIDLDELLADAEDLARLEPDTPADVFLLAYAYELSDRLEDAAGAWRHAVSLDPNEASLHRYLGLALVKLGRQEEALDAFSDAIRLEPGHAPVHAYRGSTLIELGRDEEALEAISEAALLDPDRPGFHSLRGLALLGLGRDEEALDAFTRASELDPSDDDHHDSRGLALGSLGRHREAVEAYEQAIALRPDNPEHHNSLADALRAAGRFEEAERAAERAMALDGDDALYRFTLAQIALSQRAYDRTLDILREALEQWGAERVTAPGETDLLCEILWEAAPSSGRRDLIERLVALYQEFGVLDKLGRGVVSTIPLFVDERVGQEEARAWVRDWDDVASALAIPLSILRAALGWKADHDRSHLLALPAEQRKILVQMLATDAQA